MVWRRQTSLPVFRSVAAIQPRMPYSAPETPVITRSLTTSGATVMTSAMAGSATLRSQAISPLALSVAIRRPSRVCEMTLSFQSATPRLLTPQQDTAPDQSLSVPGSIFQTSSPPPPVRSSL